LGKRDKAPLQRLTSRMKSALLLRPSIGALILFCLCVGLKLNGSSVGMWRSLLTESGIARGLIFSSPKQVRVDEWGIWTPSMLSQARQNPRFPIENPSLGAARAPLLMSIPVSYYTTLFRPQLWGFFVFDFERGFSFYWYAKIFGLLIAVGWMLREIGMRSRFLIGFAAIWIFFSSYVQWWFSSPAMLPEMVATWAICLGCAARFFKDRNRWRTTAALAGFVFCGVNFVLCLYPPYQIPLLLLMTATLIGVGLENRLIAERRSTTQALLLIIGGLLTIAVVLIPFWFDVRATLEIVRNTAYPGGRRSSGGDLDLFKLFSGVLGFFESEQASPAVYDNISEASNFYPLWPATLLALWVARFRNKTPISPLIISLTICLVLLSLYCLMPLPHWLARATLLNFATERRALLAIGLANIFLCCFFLDRHRAPIFSKSGAAIAGVVLWLATLLLLWQGGIPNAVYFSDWWAWGQSLALSGVVLVMFFWERLRFRWLPALLGTLLVFSNCTINPVMRGLGPLLDSEAFKRIDRIRGADPGGKWIVYHTRYFAQLVKATGATVFNGTKIVPDVAFFRQLDPDEDDFTYNRYANIGCEVPRLSHQVSTGLVYPDFYILFLPPDLPLLEKAGYRYVLFPKDWPEAASYGFALIDRVMPGDLWIYRRVDRSN
jgi:hypothetical protein